MKNKYITPYNFDFSVFLESPVADNLTEEGMSEEVDVLVERFLRFGQFFPADEGSYDFGDEELDIPYDIFADPDADLVDAWDVMQQAESDYLRLLKSKGKTPRKAKASVESAPASSSSADEKMPEEYEPRSGDSSAGLDSSAD